MKTPDLDKAFPKTPSYVHRCVLAAFEEGERRADQKRRRLTALCCAAAMLLVFIAGGFAVGRKLLSSPDSLLPPLSAASTAPVSTPSASPDPALSDMTWYDPNAAYTVSAARLYVDGLDDCFGRTDSAANPDLSAILQSTLTAQTELTAYMSESFTPPLVLEIDYTEKDGRSEKGTVCARLNWNSGLNLFYTGGHSWALENGCDALFAAMNVDTDALREAQARVQAAGSTPVPAVTPVPTATSALPTAAPTAAVTTEAAFTAAPSPTVTPEPTAAPDDSETDAEALPEGAPFAPDDIHDLIEAQLYIGSYVYFATDETNALREMEKLLSGAEAIKGGAACPYGPRLYLTRADGVTGYIEPAYDSCGNFRSGDAEYAYSADGGYALWDVMGIIPDEVLELMLNVGSDAVFVVPGSSYYHVSTGCDALNYERNAYAMLSGSETGEHVDGSIIRPMSQTGGLTPCAYCAQPVYATESGLFYHADPECSGMTGAREYTLTAARAADKSPCPICMGGDADILSERALVLLVPARLGGGERYHGNAACPYFLLEKSSASYESDGTDFSLSDWCVSEADAEEMGAAPCEYCTEANVFATPNGQWYHTDPECSGMMNASAYTVMQAESEGKTACPVCIAKKDDTYQSKVRGKTVSPTPSPAPENGSAPYGNTESAVDDAAAGVDVSASYDGTKNAASASE